MALLLVSFEEVLSSYRLLRHPPRGETIPPLDAPEGMLIAKWPLVATQDSNAHGNAQQQKAYTAKGKQSGSRNGHPAKGPNTQACRGCGKLGGSAHTLPPHTNLTHL